jgi:hypothetical protein
MADRSRVTGSRRWQGTPRRGAEGQTGAGRQRKILAILAALLALGGALAAWVLYPRGLPRPHFVAIVIDQYRDPHLPARPWANRDRAALRTLGWQEQNAFTSQEGGLLLQLLRDLGGNQPVDHPLVVYLSAYAVADEGGVFLLPADARLDNPKTWLPLGDVLAPLRNCRVQRKLLLLDLAQPFTDPRVGILSDDVTEHLEPLVRQALEGADGLQVLCSCSPGQTSLASEEAGHTVFVEFLRQGLRGRADGFGTRGLADGRVSVVELANYVTAWTDRWAATNRRARQTPILLGGPDDYSLTVAENPEEDDSSLDKKYPAWLGSGWELRDRWLADALAPTSPDLVRALESALLRAESRWRTGVEIDKVQKELRESIDRLSSQRTERVGAAAKGEPRSLCEAEARGKKPPGGSPAEALRPLKFLGTLFGQVQQPKADDKAREALAREKDQFLKPFKDKPFDLAYVVFHAALADEAPRAEDVRCWSALLHPEDQPPPPYEEIAFLRRVAGLKVDKPEDWPTAAVREALQLVQEASQTEVQLLVPQPWLAAPLAEVTTRRRQALDLLFGPDLAGRKKAAETLSEATRLYRDLGWQARTLREAQRCRDEALILLPGYAAYLENDPENLQPWQQAAEQARQLRDVLAQPLKGPPGGDLLRRLEGQAANLRKSLNTLRQATDPDRLERLIAQSRRAATADPREISAVLLLPCLPGRARADLWSAWRELSGRLDQEARFGPPPEALEPWDANRALVHVRERALLRATISLTLLQLDGATGTDGVANALEKVRRAPGESAGWQALRRELASAWKRREADRPDKDTSGSDPNFRAR